jgi:hypothetical protein
MARYRSGVQSKSETDEVEKHTSSTVNTVLRLPQIVLRGELRVPQRVLKLWLHLVQT